MFKVIQSVIKSDTGALHKFIDFCSCLEPKHSPHLRTTKDPRAIAINRERFKRVPWQISLKLFQVVLNILGKFKPHSHHVSPDAGHSRHFGCCPLTRL
jgi:hypothetical protein